METMKKLMGLFLIGFLVFGGVAFAETQIDEGQSKDSSLGRRIFFVGRYARTTAIATSGNMISKDRVVVWDSVSADGFTINYSTTSNDSLVAGVAMDDIPGSSRDSTAAVDLGNPNWGRIQVWGKHAAVSWDQSTSGLGSTGLSVGSLVGVSARNAGASGMFLRTSADMIRSAVSTDSLGVLLNAPASSDKTVDIFIQRG